MVPVSPRQLRPVRQILDNHWEVTTPENIAFQYRLAGPFRRLLAFALDVFITQVLYWIVVGLLAWGVLTAGAILSGAVGGMGELLGGLFLMLAIVGSFAVTWFYGAIAETYWNGQTIGKRVLGVRVLSVDGKSIDGSQAVLRNFFRFIDLTPFAPIALLYGLREEGLQEVIVPTFVAGLIIMTLNRRFRRVGDLVAGTVVVYEEPRREIQLGTLDNLVAARKLATVLPADLFVPRTLLTALAAYVSRRPRLSPARVQEIAGRLGPVLISKLGLPDYTDHDLLLCAVYFRAYFGDTPDDESLPLIRGSSAGASPSRS